MSWETELGQNKHALEQYHTKPAQVETVAINDALAIHKSSIRGNMNIILTRLRRLSATVEEIASSIVLGTRL